MRSRKLPTTEHQNIISLYQSGKTSSYLAKMYGVTDVAILKVMKTYGVRSRNPSLARMVYPLWHEAFSTLTQESAYWIGFLMADGCVLDESKVVLALKCDDKSHVEKFRTFLRTESRPIYDVPSTKSCALKIHSRQIVKDLARYGVVNNKSLTACCRNDIHLEPAFWLGMMDGDGSIDLRLKRPRVRMIGTQETMNQFREFLKHHNIQGRRKTSHVSMHKRKNIWHVTLTGIRAVNFLKFVYQSSPVHLDRKYQTALTFTHPYTISPNKLN